jgi:hypothetical protein
VRTGTLRQPRPAPADCPFDASEPRPARRLGVTTPRRGALLVLLLLGLLPPARALAATVQGITIEKSSGLGIGTTVFLGGCCQTDTVAPDYAYSFPNVEAGPRLMSVNLPISYENGGSVEYSVCVNATGACHTEDTWVLAPNYATQVTVPGSGFIDVWWRFTPGPPPTTTTTTLIPHAVDGYVLLGLSIPSSPIAGKVVLGDQLFVSEGNVGVNDPSPASLRFGTSSFTPDGSIVVAQKCNSDLVPTPPPSDTSLFNVAGNLGDGTSGACPGLARGAAVSLSFPVVATPPTLPSLSTGSLQNLTVSDVTTLDAGTYTYGTVKVPSMTKLLFNGPVILQVRDGITVGEFGAVGPSAQSGIGPNDIQVTCGNASDAGACPLITFDRASHVAMALYAPNTKVNVNRSVRFKGRLVANFVNGDQTLLFRAAKTPVQGPFTQFTTLTQEEYGAATGRAHDVYLPQNPGILPVTVGAPGIRSLEVRDPTALQCFLPATNVAGGAPAALCATTAVQGKNDCHTISAAFPASMVVAEDCSNVDATATGSNGQGGGTLTGQTIAAKLNVALSRLNATGPGLGDFVLPQCLCTNTTAYGDCGTAGRWIDNSNQQLQGRAAGLEDGLTTVDDLIAQADEALGSDCNRSGVCSSTCSTAFAPPDPIRIGEIEWTLKAVNECFSGTGADGQPPRVVSGCTCPVAQQSTCLQ